MTNNQIIQKFVEDLTRRINFRMENFGDDYAKAKRMVSLETCAGKKCWELIDENFKSSEQSMDAV